MTKNVNVVDEFGNRYVPTYAKRAKGLVKNGRARWVDENTICLACPPDDKNLEDTKMDKNMINPIDGMAVETKTSELPAARNGMTLMDILERMDKIIAQGAELANVVQQIKDLPVNTSESFGGQDGASRAEAIGDIYKSREKTNQRMLDMLEIMYNDMMGKPEKQSRVGNAFETIAKMDFSEMDPGIAAIIVNAMMGNNPA